MSDGCAMGILTLEKVDPCLSVQANQVLCGLELALGLVVLALMLRESKRATFLLRLMMAFYFFQVVGIIIVCAISLAEADPTLEAKYAVYGFAHLAFALAVSCRTSILAQVVYTSLRRDRSKVWMISVFLYTTATIASIITIILWVFTPLYAAPGWESENFRRAGFLVYGTYLLMFMIGLAGVSRHVIKLYVGLRADSEDVQKRKKGMLILWQMTISSVVAMCIAATMYLAIGGIIGGLRNEAAHIVFWLSELSILFVLRFVKQSAEIREQHRNNELQLGAKRHSIQPKASASPRGKAKQPGFLHPDGQASRGEGSRGTDTRGQDRSREVPSTSEGRTQQPDEEEQESQPQQPQSQSQPCLIDRLRAISGLHQPAPIERLQQQQQQNSQQAESTHPSQNREPLTIEVEEV